MQFTNLKIKLKTILNELTLENYPDCYEEFLEPIREYAAVGGEKDKVLAFLRALDSEFQDNELKEDIILEASNRITGYCSAWKAIHFKK